MLLATKVEEECRSIRSIIATFAHVYRRRRLRYGDGDLPPPSNDDHMAMADGASDLTNNERENALRSVGPMPTHGPIYAEWRDAMIRAETEILVSLGFTLHWITDCHPHRFIFYFARVLEIGGGGGGGEKTENNDGISGMGGAGDDDGTTTTASCVMQASWNYCNDSCRTDLCVRYDPEVIVSYRCCCWF
jgi:hypothetical protein